MKLSEYKENKGNQRKTVEQREQSITVEQLFNNYKDMNSNQLFEELFNRVNESKKNGTFDFDKLKESIQQIMPYLSEEQQKNVLSILGQIK